MTMIVQNRAPTAMRGWTAARYILLLGAALSALTCWYHMAAGTPEVMGPLHAAGIAPEAAAVLDVIWVQISALVVGGGIAMAVAAFRPAWRRPVAFLVGGHYLVISAISLGYGLAWFGNITALPQWAVFGALALLMIWAARSR